MSPADCQSFWYTWSMVIDCFYLYPCAACGSNSNKRQLTPRSMPPTNDLFTVTTHQRNSPMPVCSICGGVLCGCGVKSLLILLLLLEHVYVLGLPATCAVLSRAVAVALQDILSKFTGCWHMRPIDNAQGTAQGCSSVLQQDVLPKGRCVCVGGEFLVYPKPSSGKARMHAHAHAHAQHHRAPRKTPSNTFT